MEDGLGEIGERGASCSIARSLNPCFSGGWSRSTKSAVVVDDECVVLILVLVEDGLGGTILAAPDTDTAVLILVLVEDGLGARENRGGYGYVRLSLNPCFSGGWSRSVHRLEGRHGRLVLILVLVEDGLGAIDALKGTAPNWLS